VAKDGRSPHALRHTYAGVMTATGVPSLALMAWMGHSSTATPAISAALATRYQEAVAGWPRGQWRLLG
jgi:integrase